MIIEFKTRCLKVIVFVLLSFMVSFADFSAWTHHKVITLYTTQDHNTEGLTDFPVLIRLNAMNFSFENARANGEDIRFTDGTGTTELAYEIQSFDPVNQRAEIWVKVSYGNFEGSHDVTMHWGKPDAAGSSISGSTHVFNSTSNFLGAWHLEENRPVETNKTIFKDAVGVKPARDNVGQWTSDQEDNFIGNSPYFDGDADYIHAITSTTAGEGYQDLASSAMEKFTISAWFRTSEPSATGTPGNFFGTQTIMEFRERTAQESNVPFWLGLCEKPGQTTVSTVCTGRKREDTGNLVKGTAIVNDDKWHHVAAVLDYAGATDSYKIYVDGILDVSGTFANNFYTDVANGVNCDMGFGARTPGGTASAHDVNEFTGFIDEVRVEKTNRDEFWIEMAYATQIPGSAFVRIPSEYLPITGGTVTGDVVYGDDNVTLRLGKDGVKVKKWRIEE